MIFWEKIHRYRVYRHTQMPESHGGEIRKTLMFSFPEAGAAWDQARKENAANDRDFYMFSTEDFGKEEKIRVEQTF